MEEMNFGLPKMRVSEEGTEVIVKVWISGMEEKDFEFEIKEHSLKVNAGKEFKREDKGRDFFEKEWRSSSFSGEVSLPCKVGPMIKSKSYDGKVLEVRLEKA